jgi:hypothetical protein
MGFFLHNILFSLIRYSVRAAFVVRARRFAILLTNIALRALSGLSLLFVFSCGALVYAFAFGIHTDTLVVSFFVLSSSTEFLLY